MGACELVPKLPSPETCPGSLKGAQERLVGLNAVRATLTVIGTQEEWADWDVGNRDPLSLQIFPGKKLFHWVLIFSPWFDVSGAWWPCQHCQDHTGGPGSPWWVAWGWNRDVVAKDPPVRALSQGYSMPWGSQQQFCLIFFGTKWNIPTIPTFSINTALQVGRAHTSLTRLPNTSLCL